MVSKDLCSWVLKGVKATNGETMSFWKTNFNMPVPDLFSGSSTWSNGFMCSRCGNIGMTSQVLSDFSPGYEVVVGDGLFRWETSAGECLNGIARVCIDWYNPSGRTFCYATNVCINQGECYQTWYEIMANQGIASWEICSNGTHCTRVGAIASADGDDVSIGTCTTCFDFYSVPSVTQNSNVRGSIWVEENNLNYGNANCWVHSIVGCDKGLFLVTPGSIWIDSEIGDYGGPYFLFWTGSDCHIYRTKWSICQFCSSFSNGPGPNPSPGASYAGSLWVDSEYGDTHLAYIGCDGNKYVTGAGNYPYISPY